MTPRALLILIALSLIELLAAYAHRVYSEYGKILGREVEENLDAWERDVEPRLGMTRDQASMCAQVLEVLALALIALELGALLFDRGPIYQPPTALEFTQALLALGLIVALFNQLLPALLVIRTRGEWARKLIFLFVPLLWIVAPIALIAGIFLSLASLSEPKQNPDNVSADNVEALIEAGEEEGILEESDKDLVRSAVEFGDTLVREVMTPRPKIFAVPGTMTLEKFLDAWREQNYSRVPVFNGAIDNITGIAIAHDLLRITDAEARTRTVQSIQRPVTFVPEIKRGYELLRELQRQKQHMCIVIDEYGAVAGVATIEDLLEEIVGDIRDERDIDTPLEETIQDADGAWLLPGEFEVSNLSALLGIPIELGEHFTATTLGGLVSEAAGTIPHAGELVEIDGTTLKIEVLSSTDRRVERVKILPLTTEEFIVDS